jgi:hypothetical protein
VGATVLGALGIVVLVVGTFLPWLRSGRATRNSYEATGAVRRLVHPPGILDDLFRVWPLLGALCAVAVAVYALGLRRVGAGIGMLASLAGGAAAVAALNASGNAYASVTDTGPAITLVGAAIVVVSVGAQLVIRERPAAYGRSRHDPAAE